ncbi:MAG: adenylyltransferase/cytidyltransferase family protein [Desulfovibrionaceae bacterium]
MTSPDLSHPKVLAIEAFLARKRNFPSNYRLVFTNGCFDLLHPGHVDLLQRCRSLGHGLIVGLNSDASVRSLNKGPDRPLTPAPHRAFVLAGLECVDFVVEFEESTPARLVEQVRPQVLVKGGDWPVEKIVGRETVEADGGQVLSLPLLPGFSTTLLIQAIRAGAELG